MKEGQICPNGGKTQIVPHGERAKSVRILYEPGAKKHTYERLYVLPSLYVLPNLYVLQNLYVRSYVRLYVPQNLYVHLYVRSYGHFYVLPSLLGALVWALMCAPKLVKALFF